MRVMIESVDPPKVGRSDRSVMYHVWYEWKGLTGWVRGQQTRSEVIALVRVVERDKTIDREKDEDYDWWHTYFRQVEWDGFEEHWVVWVFQEWLD